MSALEGTVGGNLDQESTIGAVVNLFPVTDPALWDEETETQERPAPGTFASKRPSWPPPPRAALMLGVEHVRDAPELVRQANPLTYLGRAQLPPFLNAVTMLSPGVATNFGMSELPTSYTRKLWMRVKKKAAYLPGC